MQNGVRLTILIVLIVPVLAGLAGIFLPGLGVFPLLGRSEISADAFFELFATPGIYHAICLSLWTGIVATIISYLLAMTLLACLFGAESNRWLFRLISPLLSVPHITVAIGLMFLLQPSGWLVRAVSPVLTGWDRPPNRHASNVIARR